MKSAELMEHILQYWKETDAFQESIRSRSADMSWKFFDGPPFTSGDPHYGHLMQSTVKDMLPRYMTMRGYRVDRKWGWDCHGIPAENFVNKKLGITDKKQVGDHPDAIISLQGYIEECRSMVGDVNDNWKRFVDHVGRRVDMDNAYFTMDRTFMESVINVFSDLYDKNLIYKGFKVLGYSRALGTALSNSEIAEGYIDRQDPAVTVKMTLQGEHSDQYESTDDGFIEVGVGLVRDENNRLLVVYDVSNDAWFIPGGKIDKGENLEEAIKRELKEELDIDIVGSSYMGSIKFAHKGQRHLNYMNVERSGEIKNMEPAKQGAIAWAEKIDFDNELGYAIRLDVIGEEGTTIESDPATMTKDFSDFIIVANDILATPGMKDAPVSLLAWTTTPWTLPSNMLGAVNKDLDYAYIYDLAEQEYFVIAKDLVHKYYKNTEDYVLLYILKGSAFIGLKYTPLFDYMYTAEHIDSAYHDKYHQIVHADFVTSSAGTGIAHQAPAFGEDDYNMVVSLRDEKNDILFDAAKAKQWLFNPVDDHGEFTADVQDFQGVNVIESNKAVIAALKEKNLLVKLETIDHSYPHCPRTKTPLIYRAMESWFVKEKQLSADTVAGAEEINFEPPLVKNRMVTGLASAPDWNISRSRFWGSPLPVWECESEGCEERSVYGSIAEIEAVSGQEVKDLHRPYIDDVTVPCTCGGTMKRIPEVLDCRFESGSMPYGQDNYLKGGNNEGEKSPVADFIAEGLDQTRGWFRTLHVLGHAYMNTNIYKNCVCTGMILAEDGKKMSKSLKNYPDPRGLLEQYGADSFRLYMMASPVVRAEPLKFAEKGVEQMLKDFVIPLQNVWNFFKTYAEVDGWKSSGTELYFMRHAEKVEKADLNLKDDETISSKYLTLNSNGETQLLSDEFREKVTRINPDIIVSSDFERTQQTAEGAKIIVKHILNKDIQIDVRDDLAFNMTAENVANILSDIYETYKGKKVLIVGHRKRFVYIWNYLTGSNHPDDAAFYESLDTTEVVKLPNTKITNELDQWMMSELAAMKKQLDVYLEAYQIEPATKLLVEFLDSVTNRWLRRSRRRFWANGMDDDKQAAYETLREVLSIYTRLAAPFAPFTTEWVWQEMGSLCVDDTSRSSVHLEYRPLVSTKRINEELSDEIAQVRKVIKGAMYLRAKHQIKVKQPLKELKFKV